MQKLYVARDADGQIWAFDSVPERVGDIWEHKDGDCYALDNKMFPQIDWATPPCVIEVKPLRQEGRKVY